MIDDETLRAFLRELAPIQSLGADLQSVSIAPDRGGRGTPDADGLADGQEPGCPAGPNRLLADSDNDGFVDPAEIAFGSNPCSAASGITVQYSSMPSAANSASIDGDCPTARWASQRCTDASCA